ncbi:unnamed protein product [Cuscuta europaea]|uniref:Uncharacterized protein n=1 Tax=Cuscuta europaea TaxID=41803 RepID=A0A9P1EJB2_CUSEU|nr:unnamed protein product [Cuscuta europaea]
MENQNVIIRYNFDKQKDPKTGMWYAICKWCEKMYHGGFRRIRDGNQAYEVM